MDEDILVEVVVNSTELLVEWLHVHALALRHLRVGAPLALQPLCEIVTGLTGWQLALGWQCYVPEATPS